MSKNQREESDLCDNGKRLKTADEAEEVVDGEVVNEDENDDEVLIKSDENEAFYGITKRINENFGRFTGFIKQSVSDFVVNEIDLDENVVRLTSFELPVNEFDQAPTKDENELEQNV
jgi:hypothetical protein